MSTLSTKTIKELVAIHNGICEADDKIASFKGRKDDLVVTVGKLMRAKRGTTIKDFSDALLMEVAETVDGQRIGHPYETILEKVLEEFPEAKTTVKCLRWYNTKLNGDANVRMPIRPRKKTVKAEVVEETPAATNDVQASTETEVADPCA